MGLHETESLWQQQAREFGGEDLISTINALMQAQQTMSQAQTTLAASQATMAADVNSIKKSFSDLVVLAFPGGDADSHRRYHDLMIRRNEEIRRLRIAIQEKTISGLIWAFIVFLGMCVWTFISSNKGS